MNRSAVDAIAAAFGESPSGIKDEADPAGHHHPYVRAGASADVALVEAPAVIAAKSVRARGQRRVVAPVRPAGPRRHRRRPVSITPAGSRLTSNNICLIGHNI